MDRRRSKRVRLSTLLTMETQDPAVVFSGRCTTFDVNCHGGLLISSRPFPYNTKLRLTIPPSNRILTAYVVRSIPNLPTRSEEHTSELQSRLHLVCRLLLEKKK